MMMMKNENLGEPNVAPLEGEIIFEILELEEEMLSTVVGGGGVIINAYQCSTQPQKPDPVT
jgi:hypothetical protein